MYSVCQRCVGKSQKHFNSSRRSDSIQLADIHVIKCIQKPKERPQEMRTKAIVYKFKCESCSFTYVGESKRCWCSRWLEHKPGVRKKTFSAIKEHAERTDHEVAKTDVNILEKGIKNYDKRRFLEMLHSVLDKNAVKVIPQFCIAHFYCTHLITYNFIHYTYRLKKKLWQFYVTSKHPWLHLCKELR